MAPPPSDLLWAARRGARAVPAPRRCPLAVGKVGDVGEEPGPTQPQSGSIGRGATVLATVVEHCASREVASQERDLRLGDAVAHGGDHWPPEHGVGPHGAEEPLDHHHVVTAEGDRAVQVVELQATVELLPRRQLVLALAPRGSRRSAGRSRPPPGRAGRGSGRSRAPASGLCRGRSRDRRRGPPPG